MLVADLSFSSFSMLGPKSTFFGTLDVTGIPVPDTYSFAIDVVVAQFPHFPDRHCCIGEMVRVLRLGGRFAICNGGGGAPVWPLKNAPTPADIPKGGVVDGLFRSCLETYFPQRIARPAGNAPVQSVDPRTALRNELEPVGLLEITLWSYAYTSPFHTAEAAFEWESVRTSPYRMFPRHLSIYQHAMKPTADRRCL